MTMVPTVCLLTAGKGSRMGAYGHSLNKALLPIDGKATISHIIDKFPPETEFVVGVGFRGDQVRQYLSIAHPNRRITIVDVDNYDGPGSGPGYSLLCCRSRLQRPFYFVSCDTLWENALDWRETDNWLGVARVSAAESGRYCNLHVADGRITELKDKAHVSDPAWQAFVGFCYIRDHALFWSALESTETVAGEHQISNGLKALIRAGQVSARPIEWTDVGDYEKYKKVVQRYENYDFSKQNEALYIVNRKVIKFFADARITERRVRKAQLNPAVFPTVSDHQGQFYAYDFLPGRTLYQMNSPRTFERLLEWLERNLWQRVTVEPEAMRRLCLTFYRDKTVERLAMYHEKYAVADAGSSVNGRSIPSTSDLLARVPWNTLADGIPTFMHGDLQFDNILYDEATHAFTLLDWRQDFAGEVGFGDLYYDLAKLHGGIILNYDYIKLNLLTYEENSEGIGFDFAQRYQTNTYLGMLAAYIERHGYDLRKVRILNALIYLNMAPLHHFPFDKMLYSLGRQMLCEQLEAIA